MLIEAPQLLVGIHHPQLPTPQEEEGSPVTSLWPGQDYSQLVSRASILPAVADYTKNTDSSILFYKKNGHGNHR